MANTTPGSGRVVFNGVNGATGGYVLPPLPPEQLSRLARRMVLDPDELGELQKRHRQAERTFGTRRGVDAKDLSSAGWGVIFAESADPRVVEALDSLLQHRRGQASKAENGRYRELRYGPGETKMQFLERHHAAPGAVDPDVLPYYLLIVGGPDQIPFSFQYQLDVQHAVGRIHFDAVEDYANYAESVVRAETGGVARARRVEFIATEHPDDPATTRSASHLVRPLATRLGQNGTGWEVESSIGGAASGAHFLEAITARDGPRLLFTATHGVVFPADDEGLQLRRQGALLCQDYSEFWGSPPAEDHFVSSDHIADDADLLGLIAFHFACFGAGTPRWDEFPVAGGEQNPVALASRPFVAGLPKRLLGHPGGGALAVVGHVDRAWSYSFEWPGLGTHNAVYEDCLRALLDGEPVGLAFECFNNRYAELATELGQRLDLARRRFVPDPLGLAELVTIHNDARGFAILGDPAVRLAQGPATTPQPATTARRDVPARRTAHEKQNGAPAPAAAPAQVPQESPVPAAELSGVDFPIFRDAAKQVGTRLASALESLADTLGGALERAVDEVSVLSVATYVTDDPSAATYDRATNRFHGATLHALTQLGIDGDAAQLLDKVPEGDSDALWKMHLSLLEQARATRQELIKTAASAVAGLIDAMKAL